MERFQLSLFSQSLSIEFKSSMGNPEALDQDLLVKVWSSMYLLETMKASTRLVNIV